MSDKFRRELDKVGPGGVKCDCCNPYKGKERKKLHRITRHRLKQALSKNIRFLEIL